MRYVALLPWWVRDLYCNTTYSLSYDRSAASSKSSSPKRAMYVLYFNFQYLLISLKSSSTYFRLRFTHIPSSILPLITFLEISSYERCDQPSYPPSFIAFRIFISLAVCYTSSFITQSTQLILSILLQHHISKLSRYYWSTFPSVQVSAPNELFLFVGEMNFLIRICSSISSKTSWIKPV